MKGLGSDTAALLGGMKPPSDKEIRAQFERDRARVFELTHCDLADDVRLVCDGVRRESCEDYVDYKLATILL